MEAHGARVTHTQYNKFEGLRLSVGFSLKRVLIDDWNVRLSLATPRLTHVPLTHTPLLPPLSHQNITQQNMLLRLPARLTVAQLLDTFVNTSRSKAESAYLAKGLRELFNDTLPQGLLYRFERPQFESLFGLDKRGRKGGRVQKRQPAEVYGTEHFLRFIGTTVTCGVSHDMQGPSPLTHTFVVCVCVSTVKLREVLDVSMYSATDLVDLEKYLMLFLKYAPLPSLVLLPPLTTPCGMLPL